MLTAAFLAALTVGALDASCNSLHVPDPGLANSRPNSQAGVFGVYTRFPMPGAQPDFFTRLAPNGVTYRLYTQPTASPWYCAPVWRIADQSDMAYGGVVKILSNATDATLIRSTDEAVGLELYGRPPLNGLQLACMDAPTPAPAPTGGGGLPAPTTGGGDAGGSSAQLPVPGTAGPTTTAAPTLAPPAQTGGEMAVGIVAAVLLSGGGFVFYRRHRMRTAAANFRGDASQLFRGSSAQVNPFQASSSSSSSAAAPYQAAHSTHSSDL